jgi:DNA-binding protein HU-beta
LHLTKEVQAVLPPLVTENGKKQQLSQLTWQTSAACKKRTNHKKMKTELESDESPNKAAVQSAADLKAAAEAGASATVAQALAGSTSVAKAAATKANDAKATVPKGATAAKTAPPKKIKETSTAHSETATRGEIAED